MGEENGRLRSAVARRRADVDRLFVRLDRAMAATPLWIAVTVATLTLQLALIASHRPWADEWQALQLALEMPDLHNLFVNLRYEGHPALWYILLRGVRGLVGHGLWVLPATSFAIALPVQAVILFHSPFRRVDRLCIALSEFVLFEFLTVSRSLSLGVACMLMAVALWNRPRLSWLFVAVLPQCDLLFGVVSAIFVCFRFRERRMVWPLALLWLLSGLFAAWTVRRMPDLFNDVPWSDRGVLLGVGYWLADVSTIGFPMQVFLFKPAWNNPPPVGLDTLGLLGFAYVAWSETRARIEDRVALAFLVALTGVFSLYVYPLANRHLMLIGWLLILLIWRRQLAGGAGPGTWTRLWLLVAAVCGLVTAAINGIVPFDRAGQAVSEIRRMGLTDRNWVAFPRLSGEGLAALGGMAFERLGERCSEDFLHWNYTADQAITNPVQLFDALSRKRDEIGRFYLVTRYGVPQRPGVVRELAQIPAGYDGQNYNLYVVGEDRPERNDRVSHCAAPLVPFGPR
jgi:hypothetical protein